MDYYWTINGVIPPDESAGLRNGSAYTNAIAAETMRFADYVHGILSLPNSSRTGKSL
jgi:trehalose/maltose hydrolase-like predicted phosphorylase